MVALLHLHGPDTWSIPELEPGVTIRSNLRGSPDVILAFVRSHAELRKRCPRPVETLTADGTLWLVWPRKAGGHVGDVTSSRSATNCCRPAWWTRRWSRSMTTGTACASCGAGNAATRLPVSRRSAERRNSELTTRPIMLGGERPFVGVDIRQPPLGNAPSWSASLPGGAHGAPVAGRSVSPSDGDTACLPFRPHCGGRPANRAAPQDGRPPRPVMVH